MSDDNSPARIARFGRCVLSINSGDLAADGVVTRLGRRTVMLLLTLLEANGELVTKESILSKVWPKNIVGENTLQVHISGLRKALGADRDLLRTVSGRGYRLSVPTREDLGPSSAPTAADLKTRSVPASNLPLSASPIIGRELDMVPISRVAGHERLVTLTGPAGIGKTRLAIEVARGSQSGFPGGVFIVELAALRDAELLSQLVSQTLGLPSSADTPERVARAIGTTQILLVLDNCEHLIEAAAVLAEAILHLTPAVHVIATSREPLRADSEHVIVVSPLGFPANETCSRENIIGAGAVRLFLERAMAAGFSVAFDDNTYRAISEICRRLDGIPLAIELAAVRAPTLGVDEILHRLNDRLQLLSGGMRTALPRHQTLRAALDWSYDNLSPDEKLVFERLSVFHGAFDITAATCVGSSDGSNESDVLQILADLASKSLIASDFSGPVALYRYLETMRIYAGEKCHLSGHSDSAHIAHLEHFKQVLQQAENELKLLNTLDWVKKYKRHINEVQNALDWGFQSETSAIRAVDLTVLATTLWTQTSLERTFASWVLRALSIVRSDEDRGNLDRRMRLNIALGKNWTYGLTPHLSAIQHYMIGYDLACELGHVDQALSAMWGLVANGVNRGNLERGTAMAEEFSALAARSNDPFNAVAADRVKGVLLYLSHDLVGAKQFLTQSIDAYDFKQMPASRLRFGVDVRSAARYSLAHVLWLLGLTDQATGMMLRNIEDTEDIGHPLSLCTVLGASAIPISIFTGALDNADAFVARLFLEADSHLLDHWAVAATFFQGVIQTRRGNVEEGLRLMKGTAEALSTMSFLPSYFLPVQAHVGEALSLCGRPEEGVSAIESCFLQENLCNRTWYLPELLRMKASAVLHTTRPSRVEEAFSILGTSIALAQRQNSVAFELRGLNTLAALLLEQGRSTTVFDQLASLRQRFTEGLGTQDLVASERLLLSWNRSTKAA